MVNERGTPVLVTGRTFRRVALALTILLLTGVSWARAGAAPVVEETEYSETLPFTLTPGPDGCSQIKNTISGTAVINHKVRTTIHADGSRRIVDDGVSRGIATDELGRSYVYNYTNRNILNVPPAGPLVIVEMIDNFKLRGQGQTNRIDASFHWIWTYPLTNPADPLASFVFPPVDNWVQLATHGDPLKCDPI